jgi:hypothetical protein
MQISKLAKKDFLFKIISSYPEGFWPVLAFFKIILRIKFSKSNKILVKTPKDIFKTIYWQFTENDSPQEQFTTRTIHH